MLLVRQLWEKCIVVSSAKSGRKWRSLILLTVLLCSSAVMASLTVQIRAQSVTAPPNTEEQNRWNNSNTDLKIESPVGLELTNDQDFYLRYTQTLKSFESTRAIAWKISDSSQNITYTGSIMGNQDESRKIRLVKPGSYKILLTLQVDNDIVTTSKLIRVVATDATKYSNIRITEINFTTGQVEIQNQGTGNFDTRDLLLNYNQTQFNPINQALPAESYTVINLDQALNPDLGLSLEANTSGSIQTIQTVVKPSSALTTPESDASKSLQWIGGSWEYAPATLGKSNYNPILVQTKLPPTKNIVSSHNPTLPVTVRTGGSDSYWLNFIPLIAVLGLAFGGDRVLSQLFARSQGLAFQVLTLKSELLFQIILWWSRLRAWNHNLGLARIQTLINRLGTNLSSVYQSSSHSRAFRGIIIYLAGWPSFSNQYH